MITLPSYTRITLALDIIGKIKEGPLKGYHELAIVKHQIDLHDTISITSADHMALFCDHPAVPCNESNLAWRAALLLKNQFNIKDNVEISIEKRIPVQGGLAGGSANAATVISILNQLWQLNLSLDELCQVGRAVGMDVPFYFYGKTAFDTEATCVLEPIVHQGVYDFVVAMPTIGVSTKKAYGQIDYGNIGKNREKTDRVQQALTTGDRALLISSMHNDFEHSVFKHYPNLKDIQTSMINAGCEAAILSGSGSSLIGLAKDKNHAQEIDKSLSCKSMVVSTLR